MANEDEKNFFVFIPKKICLGNYSSTVGQAVGSGIHSKIDDFERFAIPFKFIPQSADL